MTKKATRVTVSGGGYLHRAMMRAADEISVAVKRAVKKEARKVVRGRKRR